MTQTSIKIINNIILKTLKYLTNLQYDEEFSSVHVVNVVPPALDNAAEPPATNKAVDVPESGDLFFVIYIYIIFF